MTRPAEVLSDFVADIRVLRSKGARASEIARVLAERGFVDSEIRGHLEAAFGAAIPSVLMEAARDTNGDFLASKFDQLIEPRLVESGSNWIQARPYPDLLRRRDRHTFRALARETGNYFVVQAALPEAAPFVGKPGFKPYPLHLLDIARLDGPNAGLVAADPESNTLRETLGALRPALTYDDYLQRLAAEGFSVSGRTEGFVVRDREGTLFYPGYRLLGVYGASSGASAWTGADGERLRWLLNRRMGEELVQFGPHDDWDRRRTLEPGNPLRGPFTPALFFTPEGNVTVRFDAESIARYYRFLKIDWGALYPAEPPLPEDDAA